jgi:hypothetical protein
MRRVGSVSSHSQISWRSAWPWLFMLFREVGRLSVTRRTWGDGKLRRALVGVGGSVVNGIFGLDLGFALDWM